MQPAIQSFEAAHEGRQQLRTHLFVSATLYGEGGSSPVNIRNMSPSGALIEAPALPDVGQRVTLKRGQLQAIGHIAWRVGRRAGIRLEAPVDVAVWMSRQASAGQARVDALVTIVRSDDSGPATVEAGRSDSPSIQAELGQLRAELSELEKALLGDVIMVATHPEIQLLDISVQRIDRILAQLRAKA